MFVCCWFSWTILAFRRVSSVRCSRKSKNWHTFNVVINAVLNFIGDEQTPKLPISNYKWTNNPGRKCCCQHRGTETCQIRCNATYSVNALKLIMRVYWRRSKWSKEKTPLAHRTHCKYRYTHSDKCCVMRNPFLFRIWSTQFTRTCQMKNSWNQRSRKLCIFRFSSQYHHILLCLFQNWQWAQPQGYRLGITRDTECWVQPDWGQI